MKKRNLFDEIKEGFDSLAKHRLPDKKQSKPKKAGQNQSK